MIVKISLRNLIRQKRRNLLLGTGIAFGMSILIIANAFSHGITDMLLNKLIIWMTGHIRVTMAEKDERRWDIIRDQDQIKQVIRAQIPGEIEIFEDVTTEGRALWNNISGNIALKGIELDEGVFRELQIEAGNPRDILNSDIENPVILYSEIAEEIGIHVNDVIQVQFQTVYRQMESARFTVVALIGGDMPFIGGSAYTHIKTLKPLLGYKPHETGALNVVLKNLENPAVVKDLANTLHQALQPSVAGYQGGVHLNGKDERVRVFAVSEDQAARQQFTTQAHVVEGSLDAALTDERTALLSQELADKLGLSVGAQIFLQYETRFEGLSPVQEYRVAAIFQASTVMTSDMLFVHARTFDHTFFPLPPKQLPGIDRHSVLSPLLVKEWNLLPRSENRDTLEAKYDELEYNDWHGTVMDVQTMYELASDILNLELVMDIVTMVAVMVLFFIILIGVVNTLRMTIRERTREIGTMRAIGMQQHDVRWSFLMEVLLLTLFASITGIVIGMIVMNLLSLISFNAYGIFTLILVENHLYFVPTLSDSIQNVLIILVIAFLTAFFPANKAAKMSASEALRHYE
jgi:ABC-type lipoprotein release transport system permease subunit